MAKHGERRAELRKKQILDAAVRCYRQHGFAGTSMKELSAASGMATGHIYHYFDCKQEIVEAVVQRFFDDRKEQLERFIVSHAGAAEPQELIRLGEIADHQLFTQIAAEAYRNSVVAEILRTEEEKLRQLVELFLMAGQANRRIAPDLDANLLSFVLSTVWVGLAQSQACSPLTVSAKSISSCWQTVQNFLSAVPVAQIKS